MAKSFTKTCEKGEPNRVVYVEDLRKGKSRNRQCYMQAVR